MRNGEGGGGEGGGGGGDGPNGPGHRLQSVASSLISLPPSVIIALAANDSAPPDPKTNRLNSSKRSAQFKQLRVFSHIERTKLGPS